MDESRPDGFPTQELPADRRWIKFGIGTLVLLLAGCGLFVPDGPVWALVLAIVVFIALVVADAGQLPIRVASHFTFDLRADGWLKRSSYLITIASVGLAMAWTCGGLGFALRLAETDLPHAKAGHVGDGLLWLGCYQLAFIYAIHRLVVRANHTDPPRIAMAPFGAVIGTMPIALAIWVASMFIKAP